MKDQIAGCIFGMAFGDAFAAPTEFMDIDDILARFPPDGPRTLTSTRVTDDTQMALAVGRALMDAQRPYQVDTLLPYLKAAFIDWYHDPENNRAPGNTCLTSISRLITAEDWRDATVIGSKGCGANMRVQPVGLLMIDPVQRAGIAQFQAALTHGHPTALAASDLTAWVIADLVQGGNISTLLDRARAYAISQRKVYHAAWLGDLASRWIYPITHGWDECLKILNRTERALIQRDDKTDPCKLVGAGWIAEEAFATALYCFLLYPDEPLKVLHRAAVTSGDSDSIACIAGAFSGAYKGLSAFPDDWQARIEYRDALHTLTKGLAE